MFHLSMTSGEKRIGKWSSRWCIGLIEGGVVMSDYRVPTLSEFPKPIRDQVYVLLKRAMIRKQERLAQQLRNELHSS